MLELGAKCYLSDTGEERHDLLLCRDLSRQSTFLEWHVGNREHASLWSNTECPGDNTNEVSLFQSHQSVFPSILCCFRKKPETGWALKQRGGLEASKFKCLAPTSPEKRVLHPPREGQVFTWKRQTQGPGLTGTAHGHGLQEQGTLASSHLWQLPPPPSIVTTRTQVQPEHQRGHHVQPRWSDRFLWLPCGCQALWETGRISWL